MVAVWSDLHHSLVTDASGAVRKVVDVNAVKTSVDNILRTQYNSRVMLPEFGCGLQDLLFSPMNELLMSKVVQNIKTAIQTWDNRVSVDGIDVLQSPDLSQVKIDLSLSIRDYDDIFNMSITF